MKYFTCNQEDVGPNITARDFPDYNPEPPIYSAKFSNTSQWGHMLVLASEDGMIAISDTTKPRPQEIKGKVTITSFLQQNKV